MQKERNLKLVPIFVLLILTSNIFSIHFNSHDIRKIQSDVEEYLIDNPEYIKDKSILNKICKHYFKTKKFIEWKSRFKIPYNTDPYLILLINTSESMYDSDRHEWFQKLSHMTRKQKDKLADILTRERIRLNEIEREHRNKEESKSFNENNYGESNLINKPLNQMTMGEIAEYYKSSDEKEKELSEEDITNLSNFISGEREHKTIKWDNGNTYTGECLGDIPDGKGTYYWKNGDKYSGNWDYAQMSGYGEFYYRNGDIYKGNFKESQFHGFGILNKISGDKYIGNWLNSKFNGKGKLHYRNGDFYEGDFKEGKINGYGSMLWSNGCKYSGEWEMEKMHGIGDYTWPNNDYYRGSFYYGKFSGSGKMALSDGRAYVGYWKEGEPVGNGNFYDSRGKLVKPQIEKNQNSSSLNLSFTEKLVVGVAGWVLIAKGLSAIMPKYSSTSNYDDGFTTNHNNPCYIILEKDEDWSGNIDYKIKCWDGDIETVFYNKNYNRYGEGFPTLFEHKTLEKAAYEACDCAIK